MLAPKRKAKEEEGGGDNRRPALTKKQSKKQQQQFDLENNNCIVSDERTTSVSPFTPMNAKSTTVMFDDSAMHSTAADVQEILQHIPQNKHDFEMFRR